MTRCFADTSYYIALVNPDDDTYEVAVEYTSTFNGEIVTTAWIVNELANHLAKPPNRALFLEMLQEMQEDARVVIVPAAPELFERGIQLYANRPDKEWSLTDCISFLVMQDQGITDALTTDHHFEQAGFNVLLK
jgi:predicted nucleic acid-binding protein